MPFYYPTATTLVSQALNQIQTATVNSPSNAGPWIVDKNSAPSWGVLNPLLSVLAAEFTASPPAGFSGKGYRTAAKLTGSYAPGVWDLGGEVFNNDYFAQTGQVAFRVWKGADPLGADAVVVGSATWITSSTIAFTAGFQIKAFSAISGEIGEIVLNDEYLFMEIAWSCVNSGGNNSASVYFRQGLSVAHRLITPAFSTPTIMTLAAAAEWPWSGPDPAFAVPTTMTLAAAAEWPWSAPAPAITLATIRTAVAAAEWPWSAPAPAFALHNPFIDPWPWQAPAPSWSWRLAPNRPRQEIHICVLTGGHVGLPDLELPISSWQARLRDTDPTYVSAVIPNALAYTSAIIARTGGQLKIYKGYKFIDQTGGRFLALVVETSLHSIRHDTGPRSSSITLVGYANITNDAPKTVAYDALTYRSLQADGRRRWRTGLKLDFSEIMDGAAWDFIARPGDTVTYQGESMVIGFISLAVSDTFELVELVEA